MAKQKALGAGINSPKSGKWNFQDIPMGELLLGVDDVAIKQYVISRLMEEELDGKMKLPARDVSRDITSSGIVALEISRGETYRNTGPISGDSVRKKTHTLERQPNRHLKRVLRKERHFEKKRRTLGKLTGEGEEIVVEVDPLLVLSDPNDGKAVDENQLASAEGLGSTWEPISQRIECISNLQLKSSQQTSEEGQSSVVADPAGETGWAAAASFSLQERGKNSSNKLLISPVRGQELQIHLARCDDPVGTEESIKFTPSLQKEESKNEELKLRNGASINPEEVNIGNSHQSPAIYSESLLEKDKNSDFWVRVLEQERREAQEALETVRKKLEEETARNEVLLESIRQSLLMKEFTDKARLVHNRSTSPLNGILQSPSTLESRKQYGRRSTPLSCMVEDIIQENHLISQEKVVNAENCDGSLRERLSVDLKTTSMKSNIQNWKSKLLNAVASNGRCNSLVKVPFYSSPSTSQSPLKRCCVNLVRCDEGVLYSVNHSSKIQKIFDLNAHQCHPLLKECYVHLVRCDKAAVDSCESTCKDYQPDKLSTSEPLPQLKRCYVPLERYDRAAVNSCKSTSQDNQPNKSSTSEPLPQLKRCYVPLARYDRGEA